nr:hypothetical protein [Tanacetum cinerariifolium]
MTLLNTLLETCAILTKQVSNLEQDKVALAIEITKLKQRVRRLEKKRQYKSSSLKRLRKDETTQRVESSADTIMDDQEDSSKHKGDGEIAELDADEDVTLEEVDAEVTMEADDIDDAEPAEVEEASAPRRRRGVIIQDSEEAATASVIDEAFAKELEAELNANINWIDVMEQNMAGFKMDFFRGITYNDIRPIFERHYNLNQAFLERVEKDVTSQKEEGSKRKDDNLEQRAAKKQKVNKEIEELKTHLQIVPNDDDDVYTEATPLALKVPVVTIKFIINTTNLTIRSSEQMELTSYS